MCAAAREATALEERRATAAEAIISVFASTPVDVVAELSIQSDVTTMISGTDSTTPPPHQPPSMFDAEDDNPHRVCMSDVCVVIRIQKQKNISFAPNAMEKLTSVAPSRSISKILWRIDCPYTEEFLSHRKRALTDDSC